MLVLTGAKGCGKTTLLKKVVCGGDLLVQGVLSEKIFSDGQLHGINLRLLPSGRQIEAAGLDAFAGAQKVGRFYFKPGLFETVEGLFDPSGWGLPFVLDEFGPLEMQGAGHFGLFEAARMCGDKLLVVVRKDLLADFLERFGTEVEQLWDLDRNSAEEILPMLKCALKGQQS